jgi:hypothetical protein
MSDKSVWQEYIRDGDTGAALAGASVTVTVESSGLPASIFSDKTGTPMANPFTSDSEGLAKFYAAEGIYKIEAVLGIETSELRDVQIGEAQSRDIGTNSTNALAVGEGDTRYEPAVLDNPTAIVDPTINDDSTAGYAFKSTWFNNAGGNIWTCADASVGAAQWFDTGITVGSLGSLAFLNSGTGGADFRDNTAADAFYEAALGNPGVTGYVLSSTTGGIRSWTAQTAFNEADDRTITGNWDYTEVITSTGATYDARTGESQFDTGPIYSLYEYDIDATNISYTGTVIGLGTPFKVDMMGVGAAETLICRSSTGIASIPTGASPPSLYTTIEHQYNPSTTAGAITLFMPNGSSPVYCSDDGSGNVAVNFNTVGTGAINLATPATGEVHTAIQTSAMNSGAPTDLAVATKKYVDDNAGGVTLTEFYVSWSSVASVTKVQTTSPDASMGTSTRVNHLFTAITTPNTDTLDNYTVLSVELQLYANSIWSDANAAHDSGQHGAKGWCNNDSIVGQTGDNAVVVSSVAACGGHGYSGSNITSAIARFKIIAIK